MTPRSFTSTPTRLADLSRPRRRLVALMQSLHYGRVEDLHVRGGEPLFSPLPAVTREVKLSGDDRPPEPAADFLLKGQVIALLAHLTRLGDGVVPRLDVKAGLPFLLHLNEPVA